MTLPDEFKKFLKENSQDNSEENREYFLTAQLERAVVILKLALPFIETWYKSSHPGLGDGAKKVMTEINEFLKDIK